MKFIPKNTFVGTNADGSTYRIQEWNYLDLLSFDIMQAVFLFVISIFLGMIIGPILVVLTILKFDGKIRLGHFLAIIICSFVLYDFYNAWLGTIVLYLFFNELQIDYFVILNIISLVLALFLTFIGPLLHIVIVQLSDNLQKSRAIFLIVLAVIISISYFYGRRLVDENAGWLSRKTGIEQAIDAPLQ